jgi:uridine phosphorylase
MTVFSTYLECIEEFSNQSRGKIMRYLDPQEFIDRRFKEHVKPEWRIAVICFRSPSDLRITIDRFRATPLKQRVLSGMDYPGDRPYVYETKIEDKPIGLVAGCIWGGPQAAILAEELSCIGVEYIIGYGLAGSISPDLPKSSHIIASKGLTTDGTSRAYTRAKSVVADAGLVQLVRSIKSDLKREVVPTPIATIDAVYQETEAAVRKWRKLGAKAINMETTPLYAASKLYGVKSIWLGYVSDCLLNEKWDDWWNLPESINEDSADICVSIIEHIVAKIY